MKKTVLALGLLVPAIASRCFAAEGAVPAGIPHLDHVFVIMMENHNISEILNNPNAPFINALAKSANLATNYFAIAHPSLTNYLETVGGSNFGVLSDNDPDWHSTICVPNLASKTSSTDNPKSPPICPIAGTGTDAATPAFDFTNETQGSPGEVNIDGVASIPAAANVAGKTIADQLDARKMSWKSYQESLPAPGADLVAYSDGVFTDSTDFTKIMPSLIPPLSPSEVVKLYAAKHNPFVYFKSVQEGGLTKTQGFEGPQGLFADLAAGAVPAFSFVAPNQCNDQHGRANGGAFCNFDPMSNGSAAGLNPALLLRADDAVRQLVTAIHNSPAWAAGHSDRPNRSAIVIVWDENDYGVAPEKNQVVLLVDTNYGVHKLQSTIRYTHFSLLKSLESGLGLPCLNHACDADVSVMSDLFRTR
jgi:hypothetical protein